MPHKFPIRVFICAAILIAAAFIFLHAEGTSDLFWHLKTGEVIWKTGEIPHSDIFSYTASGKPWLNHEWLAEVVLFAAERAGGFVALSLFSFGLGLLLAIILYSGLSRISGSKPAGLLLTFAALYIGAPRFQQLRPELFGFLLFAATLFILNESRRTGLKILWYLIPILILWANLHASVIVAPPMILLYVTISFWRDQRRRGARPIPILTLSAFAAACIASPLVNPLTHHVYTFPFEHMSHGFSLAVTSDWVAPHWLPPQIDLAPWGVALLGIVAITMIVGRHRFVDPASLAVAVAFAAMGFGMIRFIPFSAISICFLISNLRIQTGGPKRSHLITALIICIGVPILAHGVGPIHSLRSVDGRVDLILGRPVGWGIDGGDFPIDAAAFIGQSGACKAMFNDMAWGGYLIWRMWPARRVFIDTRTPVYGDAFIKEYSDALFMKPAFDRLAAKYGIDCVIYDARQIGADGAPLRFLLGNPEWRAARIGNAAVFLK